MKAMRAPELLPEAPVCQDLLARTLAGCRRSARQLYVELADDILRYGRWMGLDDSLARDVLQDVFEDAMHGRLQYQAGRTSPRSYLIGVVRLKVLANLRRTHAQVPLPESQDDESACGDVTPELLLSRRQDVREVRLAMQGLTTAHREVLVLCDFRGLDYLEAAEALGVPLGTLQSRLNRARKALRMQLALQGVSA
jgi:RNA polymerase sigma-70 factor (ECF subfamily)